MDKLEAARFRVAKRLADERAVTYLIAGYLRGEMDDSQAIRDELAALSAIPDERAAGIREGLEIAAKACEAQQQIFGSTQYATGQPWSSFGERFACGKCAEEIRALKDSPPPPTVV